MNIKKFKDNNLLDSSQVSDNGTLLTGITNEVTSNTNKITLIENKRKGYAFLQTSINGASLTTTSQTLSDTGFSFTLTTYGGDVIVKSNIPAWVSTRTLSFYVNIDGGTDYNIGITNSSVRDRVSGIVKFTNIPSGTHTVKLRWAVQTAGDVGTIANYTSMTIEAFEL